MNIKDYFFSEEIFKVIPDPLNKGILKTKPIPKNLNEYYNSENYISHNNKKKSLFNRLYFIAQKYNTYYKKKLVLKYSNNKNSILDFGAGKGDFLKEISKNFNTSYWYEPSKVASLNISKKNKKLIEVEANLNEISDNSLDVIYLWHVLEHINEPEKTLQKFNSKLKNEGKIFLALPNFNSLDAKIFKEHWAAWDVPRHIYHYSRGGIIELLEKNDYIFIKDYPLWLDAFYISIISSKYKNNLFIKLVSPIIAIISNISGLFSKNYSSNLYIFSKKSP